MRLHYVRYEMAWSGCGGRACRSCGDAGPQPGAGAGSGSQRDDEAANSTPYDGEGRGPGLGGRHGEAERPEWYRGPAYSVTRTARGIPEHHGRAISAARLW